MAEAPPRGEADEAAPDGPAEETTEEAAAEAAAAEPRRSRATPTETNDETEQD